MHGTTGLGPTTAHDAAPAPAVKPAGVECVLPLRRETCYDHVTDQALMPVAVLLQGGQAMPAQLVISPAQMVAMSRQLDRAIHSRAAANNAAAT